MAGAWRPRPRGRHPEEVLHGVERVYEGATEDLIRSAASVTLLTFAGTAVVVGDLEQTAKGGWKGKVLQTVHGASSPALGTEVEFSCAQVHSATLRDPERRTRESHDT